MGRLRLNQVQTPEEVVMLSATNQYFSIYFKAFFETFKKGVAVILITVGLYLWKPELWLSQFMIIPSVSYILFWIIQLAGYAVGLSKIATLEKRLANDRSMSVISAKIADLLKAIRESNEYVEQKAKGLLTVINTALNQGFSLEAINYTLMSVDKNCQLVVKVELNYKVETDVWITPKSATLVLYKSKTPIAQHIMFEM